MSDEGMYPGWYPTPTGQRYWDGSAWTHYAPPAPMVAAKDPYDTNHILHLLLTVFTFGLWAPVWLIIGVTNSNAKARRDGPALRASAGLPPVEPAQHKRREGGAVRWADERWDQRRA